MKFTDIVACFLLYTTGESLPKQIFNYILYAAYLVFEHYI
jgi:hypothetical protein